MAQPAESTFPGINIQGTYLGPNFPQTPQVTPPATSPLGSVQLGSDQAIGGQTQGGPGTSYVVPYNAYLSIPTGAIAPATSTTPFVLVMRFQAQSTYYANSIVGAQHLALMSNCATLSSCVIGSAGGNDALMSWIAPSAANLASGHQNELTFTVNKTSNKLFTTPVSAGNPYTGFKLVAGTNYTLFVQRPTSRLVQIAVCDQNGNCQTSTSTAVDGANLASNPFAIIGASYPTTTGNAGGAQGPYQDLAMFTGTGAGTALTLAQMQALSEGQDVAAWGVAQSLTAQSIYRMGDYPTFADSTGNYGNLTLNVTSGASAEVTASNPIGALPCIAIQQPVNADIQSVDLPSQTMGTLWAVGAVNSGSCGANVLSKGLEVRWVSSSGNTPWTRGSISGSTFRIPVHNVSALNGTTPIAYTLQVRPRASRNYVVANNTPTYVGIKLYVYWCQSQGEITFIPGTGDQQGGYESPTGIMSFIGYSRGNSSNAPPNSGYGTTSTQTITTIGTPTGFGGTPTGYEQIGGGQVEHANDLEAATNLPAQVIDGCRGGTPVDAIIDDHQAITTAMTNTAGTYSTTTASMVPDATLGGAIPQATLISPFVGSIYYGVVANGTTGGGNVTIYDNTTATAVAVDNGSGGFTGENGATVSAGAINYLTRIVSGLTFSAGVGATDSLSIKWTLVEDLVSASYVQQSTYTGFGAGGDQATAASGLETATALGINTPPTAMVGEQVTNNLIQIATVLPPANNNSGTFQALEQKYDWALFHWTQAFPWLNVSSPPLAIILGYPRDTTTNTSSFASGMQFTQNLGTNGHAGSPGTYAFGGVYYDLLTSCLGTGNTNCASPHEFWTEGGMLRMFRRQTKTELCDMFGGAYCATIASPTITSVTRASNTPSSGLGTVTFTFSLPATGATALTNCTDLSGGQTTYPAPPTNYCASTETVGAPVAGFTFGTVVGGTQQYNYQGVDPNSYGTSVVDANQFACSIASANTVTCVGAYLNQSGLYWRYMYDNLHKSGTLSPLLLTQGSTPTLYNAPGGSLTFNVTQTGGTCSVAPVIAFTLSALTAGTITNVARSNVGACTVTSPPSVTYPTVNTAGTTAVTGTGAGGTLLWQNADDWKDVGHVLYDNAGGYGGFEPGNLAQDYVVLQGPLS
jgi:hypothetical protein